MKTRENPIYSIYHSMRKRCLNKTHKAFKNYGGRGIVVCQRWLESFEAFQADMGPRPTPQHSLDREDNNGPYSPENCRWATKKQQSNNTRRTVFITAHGLTLSAATWAERNKVPLNTIRSRLGYGYTGEEAIAPKAQTSRYKGVHWCRDKKRWTVRVVKPSGKRVKMLTSDEDFAGLLYVMLSHETYKA